MRYLHSNICFNSHSLLFVLTQLVAMLTQLPIELCKLVYLELSHEDRQKMHTLSKTIWILLHQTFTTCCCSSLKPFIIPSLARSPYIRTVKFLYTPAQLATVLGPWKFAVFQTNHCRPALMLMSPSAAQTLWDSKGNNLSSNTSIINIRSASFKLKSQAETEQAARIAQCCDGVVKIVFICLVTRLFNIGHLQLPTVRHLELGRVSISELTAPNVIHLQLFNLTIPALPCHLVALQIAALDHCMSFDILPPSLLSLSVCGKAGSASVIMKPLPELRKLEMKQVTAEFVKPLSPMMEFPALEKACMHRCKLLGTQPAHLFHTYLNKSGLQTVDILTTAADEEELQQYINIASSLGVSASFDEFEVDITFA